MTRSTLHRRFLYRSALLIGRGVSWLKGALPVRHDPPAGPALRPGISVVVPSRSGMDLLARLLPGLLAELESVPHEVLVVDNGSTDGTAVLLAQQFPSVHVLYHKGPLSFSAAVNKGIRLARFRRICLLNNDMVLQPDFFSHLEAAFAEVPDLFCATAQIFFPPGMRREETGKAVMPWRPLRSLDTSFPLRCDMPVEGENLSYVLYGSGGASLYDTAKLRRLGQFGEMYRPAYVEDLDVGFRAWQRGWPTVYVARAGVIHYHRTTTSRFYKPEELELVLDVNYLRFLMRAVAEPDVFYQLWQKAIWALNLRAREENAPGHIRSAMAFARLSPKWMERPPQLALPEAEILAVGSGAVAIFPGNRSGPVLTLIVATGAGTLRHGSADPALLMICDELARPAPEVLAEYREIVQVCRSRSPEEDRLALRGVVRLLMRKYEPAEVHAVAALLPDCADLCTSARVVPLD